MNTKQNIFLLIITLSCLSSNYLLSCQEDDLDYLSRSKDELENICIYLNQKSELENIIYKLKSNPNENHKPSLEQFHDLRDEIKFRSETIIYAANKFFSMEKQTEAPKLVKATEEAYNKYVKNYNNLMSKKISESLDTAIPIKPLVDIINSYSQLEEIN